MAGAVSEAIRARSYPGKRAFDVAIVLLASPLWLPLLIALIPIVWWRLGSPVFFRQERGGVGGRPFRLLKFRSMTEERDATGALLPDAGRLPRFGRILRSTSLDELPGLFNVLRGEMSLVGPRPLFLRYVNLYSPKHRRRLDARPGITGLAQVRGRNTLSWSDRFDMDVEYVERQSLLLDLSILWDTVRTVVTGHGVAAPGQATMSEFTGYPEHGTTPAEH